jgi:hypothetical protein
MPISDLTIPLQRAILSANSPNGGRVFRTFGPGPQTKHVGERADQRRDRVTGYRTRRLATVVSSALIGLLLLGTSVVTASTPGWAFSPAIDTSLNPATVGTGYSAAFVVTLTNGGSINISAVFLSTDIPATASNSSPTYVSLPTYSHPADWGPASPCNAAGAGILNCSFGNMSPGETVKLTIAFAAAAPGTANGTTSGNLPLNCNAAPVDGSWTFHFTAFGNGNTPTDKGGKSHGDTLCGAASVKTSSSPNFAGGFQLDASAVGTTGTLNGTNDQNSSVIPPPGSALIPVTIEDGLTSNPGAGGDICLTFRCIGDWTDIHVGDGHTGPIKVTFVLYGGSLPGGVTTDKIGLWHSGSSPDPIVLRCSDLTSIPSGGTAECVTVTKVGKNFQVVAWLSNNGGSRVIY